jgi:hypothetical protein
MATISCYPFSLNRLTIAGICLLTFTAAAWAADRTGLIPITELGDGFYKGQTGGLYGDGNNIAPQAHLDAAKLASSFIVPRDADGQPSPTGRIVLISLGMSNTTQEFSLFKKLADADPNKSPYVTIVDCAQGGQAAHQWAYPNPATPGRTPWDIMDQRLRAAKVEPNQVQVVWIKQAEITPAQLGQFPFHAMTLRNDIETILHTLTARFANLRMAYLSSRIYAGYATTQLNPEPYAYESAFSVQWLIADQFNSDPNLNYDFAKGPALSPVLMWGPYLWADGIQPRQADGMVWLRQDLGPDGTHPSEIGRQKVAQMLLTFFKTDPNTQKWFLRPPKENDPTAY